VYVATVLEARVDARMDRGCSWWNPNDRGLPQAYILQHEQIHFALFELAARKLNAELAALMSRFRATAPTEAEARTQAEREVVGLIRSASAPLLARTRAFDEDTSMGHRPEAQARWWTKIQAELAATAD